MVVTIRPGVAAAIVLLPLLGQRPQAHADDSVSFFALRNMGSARSVGLAGATVAYPADGELAFGNPASTVWQGGLLGLRFFSHAHSKADPALRGAVSDKEGGQVVAASVKPLQPVAASAGYASTMAGFHRIIHERSALGLELASTDLPVMASARIHERVSLGGGVTFSTREYARGAGETLGSTSVKARQAFSGRNWKLGLIGAVFDAFSAGFSYESARELARSSGEGDESSRPARYLDPWVAKFGVCYLLAPTESSLLRIENAFFLQADLMGFPESGETVRHAGATLFEENPALAWPAPRTLQASDPARYAPGQRLVPRLGIETAWFRTDAAQLSTWVGSWWEPSYIDARPGTFHTTVGAEFALWFLVLQAAADVSRGDPRKVFGAGIALR